MVPNTKQALYVSVFVSVPEENQRACMFLFPLVKAWLLQISLLKPELAQPICSFTGMTVASNGEYPLLKVKLNNAVVVHAVPYQFVWWLKCILVCTDVKMPHLIHKFMQHEKTFLTILNLF